MTRDTYFVIVFWSDEDQAFIALVAELPGCMAHGKTRIIAIQQIEIAIENWIDTAHAIGRQIPSPAQDWAAVESTRIEWLIRQKELSPYCELRKPTMNRVGESRKKSTQES